MLHVLLINHIYAFDHPSRKGHTEAVTFLNPNIIHIIDLLVVCCYHCLRRIYRLQVTCTRNGTKSTDHTRPTKILRNSQKFGKPHY